MKRKRTDPWLRKQLIQSSLILIGLMLIMIVLIYVSSNVYQTRELTRSNQALLLQCINRVDETLSTIDKSILTLLIDNPSIIRYMEGDYVSTPVLSKFDVIKSLQKSIINIKSVYAPIYSIFVINDQNEQVMTEAGMHARKEVDEMLDRPLPRFTSTNLSFDFRELFMHKLDASPTMIKSVMIARNYPVYSRHLSKGMLLAWIRESDLRDMLTETLMLNNKSTISILTESETLKTFGGKDSDENQQDELADVLNEMRGLGEEVKTIEGQHYFLQHSAYTGWWYLLEMPQSKELSLLKTIRNFFLLAIIIFTGFALVLAFHSIKYTNKKVGKLASIVRTQFSEDERNERGTFQYLEGALERIIDQRQSMEGEISHYKPMAVSKLLDDLLRPGRIRSYDRHLSELKALGIDMYAAAYCIMILKYKEQTQEQNISVSRLIHRILPEGIRSTMLSHWEEGIISILLFDEGNEGQNRFALRHLCNQLVSEVKKQALEIYIGAGKIYPLPINLPAAYRTATDAIKCKLFNPELNVLIYEEIWNSYAPKQGNTDQSSKILCLLRQGDTSNDFLQEIERFYTTLSSKELRLPVFHMAVLELITNGIRVGLDMGVKHEILYEKDIFSILESTEDLEELISITKELFLFISRQISLRRNRRTLSALGTRMVTYINEHFADDDLSLTKIGSYMNISGSYASRIIREYAGINFQEYLTQIRIERAKLALKNTSMTVEQVGMLVGYSSNHSFIRRFKKLEGMSPGQWRKQTAEFRQP